MNELQLPACALLFSALLCASFFSKERVRKKENRLYAIMLICGLADSLLVSIERILVLSGKMQDVTPLINGALQITNKLDFASLIILTTCLFLYTILITIKDADYNKIRKIVVFIDIIAYILISFLDVKLIEAGGIISITGTALIPTFALCGLYLLGSIIVTLFNAKNITKKHIPIISIVFVFLFLMVIFQLNPYIVVISAVVAFVNYLMYFTIENPDIRLIDELTKTKNLAEKYNNDKSIFLFNMTQQIRTPLNTIEQATDKIFETDDLKEAKEYSVDIRNSEKRISYLVNGALDLSTMDANKIKIVENKYSINNLLNEISIKAEREASKKNLEFRKSFDTGLPELLYGDSIRLKQVINAIISNAIKFTEQGFIELNVSSVISFDVCRLLISIKDSGQGMKTEEINKLFSNEDNSEELDIDNKDIKLGIAKKMINIIGGTITVQSEKNKGSEFTIVLDQKIANESNKIMDIVNEYEESNIKKKVLFVGKDENEFNFYKKKLNIYDLVNSNTREDFLKKIRNEEVYDLILIKDEKDKITYEGLSNKLAKIGDFNIPMIVIADSIEDKDNIKFEEASSIISKDITQAKLLDVISSILDK